MEYDLKPLTTGLKKELLRLEKIAARFENSHSVHLKTVQDIIRSLSKQIKRLEAGHV
jgi:hypothetical protein